MTLASAWYFGTGEDLGRYSYPFGVDDPREAPSLSGLPAGHKERTAQNKGAHDALAKLDLSDQ